MSTTPPGGRTRAPAYVFSRNQNGANAWGQVAQLFATDGEAFGEFGYQVAVDGDTVVAGSYNDDTAGGADAGSAYVFSRNQNGANAWGQVAQIFASDGAVEDQFGQSVAVDGDTVVVGAEIDDTAGGVDAGSAYVFSRDQNGVGAWGQVAHLFAADGTAVDRFGVSVAVDGDTVAVGAFADDTAVGTDAGSAHVVSRNQNGANAWGQVTQLFDSNGAAGDLFGISIAVDGDTVVLGGGGTSGAACVFSRNQNGPNAWGQAARLFGYSVAVEGDTVVVGAPAPAMESADVFTLSEVNPPGEVSPPPTVRSGGGGALGPSLFWALAGIAVWRKADRTASTL